MGHGHAEFWGEPGEAGLGAGVAIEDIVAEKGGLELLGAVSRDGAGGGVFAAGERWMIEEGAPDVEFVAGKAGGLRSREPEGLCQVRERFQRQ